MKRVAILSVILTSCAGASLARYTAQGPGDASRGIALYEQGRYVEAEAALRGAAGNAARAYLAATLARLDRHGEAEAEARAVLEVEPTQSVAVKALGESLVKQEKLDEAIGRMTAALGSDASLAYAYYWRGQAYQRKKQVARMSEDYQQFLRLLPDAPEAPALRALLGGLR